MHLSLLLLMLLLLVFLGLGNQFFLLPSKQSKDGIVVLFYHLPRTGGTTIREHFASSVSSYMRVAKHRDWDRVEQRILAAHTKDETLFLELHGTVPGLAVLHETIQRWRSQKVHLFAFTVVREPVAWSRSYFHHFHPPNCPWNWCERDTYPQDTRQEENENILKTIVRNHQCQLLLLGQRENKKRARPLEQVTDEQCRTELMPLLEQDWDWIGTTETLETMTLPLLMQVLSLEERPARMTTTTTKNKKKNASQQRIANSAQQLLSATIQQIRQQSSFDEALYERVSRERWQRKGTG